MTLKPNAVHNRATAQFDDMPASTVKSGLAPYILPAGKMYEASAAFVKNYLVRKIPAPLPAPGGKHPFSGILMLLRSRIGHHFSLYEQNTIHCRIERCMGVHDLSDNTFPGIGRRKVPLNSRRIHNKRDEPGFILLAIENMSPVPKKADEPPCREVIPS